MKKLFNQIKFYKSQSEVIGISNGAKNMKKNFKKGFTIIEILISICIISLIIVVVSAFQKDVFTLNYTLQGSLNAQLDARHLVKVMVAEFRKTVPSAVGSYPIESPTNTSVIFYSDNVVSSSTLPVFQYYSTTYNGTNAPLPIPVDIPSIRLIKITVIIDSDPNRSPTQMVVTSSVSLRNLKDNL